MALSRQISEKFASSQKIISSIFPSLISFYAMCEKYEKKDITIRLNTRTSRCPILEYNPAFVNIVSENVLAALISVELFRLILHHPTTRLLLPAEICYQASNIICTRVEILNWNIAQHIQDYFPDVHEIEKEPGFNVAEDMFLERVFNILMNRCEQNSKNPPDNKKQNGKNQKNQSGSEQEQDQEQPGNGENQQSENTKTKEDKNAKDSQEDEKSENKKNQKKDKSKDKSKEEDSDNEDEDESDDDSIEAEDENEEESQEDKKSKKKKDKSKNKSKDEDSDDEDEDEDESDDGDDSDEDENEPDDGDDSDGSDDYSDDDYEDGKSGNSDKSDSNTKESSDKDDSEKKKDPKEDYNNYKDEADALEKHFRMQNMRKNTEGWGENSIIDQKVQSQVEREKSNPMNWGIMPADLKELITIANRVKMDPRAVLRNFARSVFSTFTSFTRRKPSKKDPNQDWIGYIPGKVYEQQSKVLFAVDTSGSMREEQIAKAIAFFMSALSQADVYFCWWDAKCGTIQKLKKRQPQMEIVGGGGTVPMCVLDKVRDEKLKFDGIVYITDCYFEFPNPLGKEKIFILKTDDAGQAPDWCKWVLSFKDIERC